MSVRWGPVLVMLLVMSILASPLLAHKMPIIEYTYVSHIWEEAFEKIPKQPVIGERIQFKASVTHPNETIEGNVTSVFALYQDDSEWNWYGGKSYKTPDFIQLLDAPGTPTARHDPTRGIHEFEQFIVIDRPGSYKLFIDWYENRQYLGQSMHTIDVERRTIGPLFYVFNGLLILGVLVGVRRGIL